MKTTFILAAAVATALAAPVAADTAFAINHFNQDIDSVLDKNVVPSGDNRVVVSTRSGSALDQAFAIFNADADSVTDLRGLNGATIYNAPAQSDIFDAIRAEGRNDE